MNRSSSKHLRVHSPMKSPLRTDPTYYEHLERTSEYKLNDRIHKLKHALKNAQKHNEQLHAKVKHYKEQCGDVLKLQEDVKKYKRKYEATHSQLDEKILETQELKLKLEYQGRSNNLKGKDGYESKIRELSADITGKQMKITHLEALNKDLHDGIQERNLRIKQLQTASENYKIKQIDQKSSKLTKIQQELQLKVAESHQHSREIGKLKDSLRESLGKLQKANSLVYEQTQKNKQISEEQKELKKLLSVMQKETSGLREGGEKIKMQNLEKLEKINKLEREKMVLDFERVRQKEKFQQLELKYLKTSQQLENVKKQHAQLEVKLQETLGYHYDIQREFQRELHTIVKELTRRHIVSKSIINNMGSSNIYSVGIKNQDCVLRQGLE